MKNTQSASKTTPPTKQHQEKAPQNLLGPCVGAADCIPFNAFSKKKKRAPPVFHVCLHGLVRKAAPCSTCLTYCCFPGDVPGGKHRLAVFPCFGVSIVFVVPYSCRMAVQPSFVDVPRLCQIVSQFLLAFLWS